MATKRKPPARTMRLLAWDEATGDGRLLLTVGKQADVYRLRRLEPGYADAAFRLEKYGQDGVVEVYDVSFEPQGDACTCMGNLAHGRCKHRDGVKKLLSEGLIGGAK